MMIFDRIKRFIYLHLLWHKKPVIRVSEASLSGNGSFVDIRYWLSRPDKVNPTGKIFIVDEDTGKKLYLLQIARFGVMCTHHDKFTNSGNILIYNRNGLIKHGSMVTLQFDSVAAKGIIVN